MRKPTIEEDGHMLYITEIVTIKKGFVVSQKHRDIKKYAQKIKTELDNYTLGLENSDLYKHNYEVLKTTYPKADMVVLFNNSYEELFYETKTEIVDYSLSSMKNSNDDDIKSLYFFRYGTGCQLIADTWLMEHGINFSRQFWFEIIEYVPQLKKILIDYDFSNLKQVKGIDSLFQYFYIDDGDCESLMSNFNQLKGSPSELKTLKMLLEGWQKKEFKLLFKNIFIAHT